MMNPAYYNENNAYAAQWLRNLIAAGHIAPGYVDERSIEDVQPDDLREFTQCHFFAGIGIWSAALRRAGWPDDRPVWTGSCPCQPFSSAGQGVGFADQRHLWPAWFYLIAVRRPPRVYGEQVANGDGLNWLDLVHTDMEAAGYATGAADICAAGVGAPHIRQRLYFVGDAGVVHPDHAHHTGLEGLGGRHQTPGGWVGEIRPIAKASELGGLADSNGVRRPAVFGESRTGLADGPDNQRAQSGPRFSFETSGLGHADGNGTGGFGGGVCGEVASIHGQHRTHDAGASSAAGGLEHPEGFGRQQRGAESSGARIVSGCSLDGLAHASGEGLEEQHRGRIESAGLAATNAHGPRLPGPTNGHWRAADWLLCRDGKWRPVEPGTFPLAHGAASRVGRLRAYGNGIVLEAAETFIRATS